MLSTTILIHLFFLFNSLHALTHTSTTPKHADWGINCAGSSQCSFTTVNSPNILREFNSTLYTAHGSTPSSHPFLPGSLPLQTNQSAAADSNNNNNKQTIYTPLPDFELFFAGEHIICAPNLSWLTGSICLFLQGDAVPTTGVPGFLIKRLVSDLLDHNCKFCGSVP
ncbi:MAG: hypothetical protein Q9168_005510, partial [Polycauliona sp. 1 TL-2023]